MPSMGQQSGEMKTRISSFYVTSECKIVSGIGVIVFKDNKIGVANQNPQRQTARALS